MSVNEKRVPNRRFKDFENAGDWEQCKLGDLSESFEYGLNAAAMEFDGENKYIRITDIDENSRLFLDKDLTSPNINLSNADNFKLKYGDIIFARTGASVGKSYIYKHFDGLVYYAGFLIRARIKKESDPEFVFYNTLTNEYNKYIRIASQRSGQPGVNAQEYAEYKIRVPNYEEQMKIGLFLRQIDNIITIHQRKLDKIRALKKSYLTCMFPAEGERKPKLRFTDFTDDWEQRKLGELANIVRGASPRPIQDQKWFDDKSTVGWLRISDVSEQDGRIHYLEQHISKEGQEKTRVLKQSHLLLSIAASVGKPVINYVSTGVHDGFLIFQNPTFDQEFMFQWMKMFEGKWQKYGQPGSQVNLNSDIIKNQVILIPKEEEQVKIGVFFSQLDNIITLHQRKIEKLQNIKKAYLNEMFI